MPVYTSAAAAASSISTVSFLSSFEQSWATTLSLAFLAGVGIVTLLAFLDARAKTAPPGLQMQPTPFNERILAQCPWIKAPYEPLPFLTNGHVETIFAAKFRRIPPLRYERECLLMPDGGCIALDWEPEDHLPEDAPVLVLLPGLTGGSQDSYVCFAVERARKQGIRAVVFNSRGTADSPVTTPQYYSASYTDDTRAVMLHVKKKYPDSVLLAAGWSLGANILVRYLGEEGSNTPVQAAVSMCNPFNLTISNAHFDKGFNRVYDYNLASSLKAIMAKHEKLWNGAKGDVMPEKARQAKTIREFDEAITIRCFGWESVDQYYAMSSSSLSVPHVKVPLLCIQALDDPIAPAEAIPFKELLDNPNCVLVATRCGGHLGWVAGHGAPFEEPWSDQAMLEWLRAVLKELKPSGASAAVAASAAGASGKAMGGAAAAVGAGKELAGAARGKQ